MGMILRIASSRIVGQGDIVGRSGYFSLNLSANSVMRGRLDARRTLKSLVADLRVNKKYICGKGSTINQRMCKINRYYAQINNDCAFPLVPALDAGTQKSRPYQSDVYGRL